MERKIVEYLRAGISLNRACRELRVSKRRVVRVRALADEAGYLDVSVALPPYPEALFPEVKDGRSERRPESWLRLDEHRGWIRERLEAGWHAVTVFEELPVKVPRSNFYRYLSRHRLNEVGRSTRRVVPEIVHLPGEALLIDWGYLWTIERAGKRTKLWAFIGVLGYSRFMVVTLMTVCDLENTLSALRSMYEAFGGVPHRTTSDNPKVFSLKADKFEPLLNPAYERFASHYGTTIECLAPRSPEHKGKVERPVPYIRRLLEAYSGDRNDVPAIQEYLNRKLELANARQHGTTRERPVDRFDHEEKVALKPLPPLPYEIEHYHEGIVRIDGHVRLLGKYYSVSEEYVRKPVTILGNSRQICIFVEGKLIETHERLHDRTRSKSTKPHHLKPWEQACANTRGLTALGAEIGPHAEAFVSRILLQGDGFIDFRRIWGLLALKKKYSAQEIDSAC
jgi:transposase